MLHWRPNLIVWMIVIFLVAGICHKQQRPRQVSSLPTTPPVTNLEMETVYFDNGIGGYWFEPTRRVSKRLVVVWPGMESIQGRMSDLCKLEALFVNHHVVYIDYPGLGLSSDLEPVLSIHHLLERLHEVYICLLRYESWNQIVFVGLDCGAIFQALLWDKCITLKTRLPDHLVQINGFASLESLQLYKIPWMLQMFCRNAEKESIAKYYQGRLRHPLLVFHSKQNRQAPFLDSVRLCRELQRESVFVPLYGHDQKTLSSKENLRLIKKAVDQYIHMSGVTISYSTNNENSSPNVSCR